MKKNLLLWGFLCLNSLLSASETIVLNQSEEQFIPIDSQKNWTLPQAKKGRRTLLALEHRIDYPKLAGWTTVMQIEVNGQKVVPQTPMNRLRLLNKPLQVPHVSAKKYPVAAGTTYYCLYSPDFKAACQSFTQGYSAQAYRLVLDVTDLIQGNGKDQFKIKVGGGFLKKFYQQTKVTRAPGIKIRNLKITQDDVASQLAKPSDSKRYEAKGKILLNEPKEIALSVMTGKKWTFPAVTKDKQIVFEFEDRIRHPSGGGWHAAMQIAVNGRNLTAMISRSLPRLLNKPHLIPHKLYGTYKSCDGIKWFSLYAKDYEFKADEFFPYDREAYRVAVDISDLVYSDKTNVAEINFGASWMPNYYRTQRLGCEPALMVRNVKITEVNRKSPLIREVKPVYITMKPQVQTRFSLTSGKNAMQLQIGKQKFPIVCSYSVPGKKEPVMLNDISGKLETSYYRISRKSIRRNNRIDFFDTFESKADKLIGIRIVHSTPAAPFDLIRLGGDDSPEMVLRRSGQNPAAWVGSTKQNVSFGLIAVDDVFRVQNEQFLDKGTVGIRSQTFALSPKEKRTIEWSIYPVASADYFDFVNEVRKDWNVNFPIEGGFAFTIPVNYAPKNHELRKMNEKFGVKFNATGCFVLRWIGGKYKNYVSTLHGSALFDEFHRGRVKPGAELGKIASGPIRDMLKKTTEAVKADLQGTDSKALCYVHNQISTELDDWNKYPDCIQTKANGQKWLYGSGNTSLHIFIPTLDNAFGKKTFDYMCRAVDELGFDGLYNDEFNHSATRTTYSMWDKVSVELDADNNVKRKIGYVPLLKLPFSLKVLHEFSVKRKVSFVANFAPETRSEIQYHVPRFEETFHNYMPLATLLYTPIQLGDQLAFPMTPEGMMADIRNALSNGLLYYYYINRTANPEIVRQMFPFTPIELHSGWLLGKERILTIHSGEYGWRNEYALSIPYICNPVGKTVVNPNAVFVPSRNGTVCRLNLAKDHCAVLVRIPVTARLQGKVSLKNLRWKKGVFTAELNGSGTALITKPGQPGKKFQVQGNSRKIQL